MVTGCVITESRPRGPSDLLRTNDILNIPVGTDPVLATQTRRGVAFYKVPSLRGCLISQLRFTLSRFATMSGAPVLGGRGLRQVTPCGHRTRSGGATGILRLPDADALLVPFAAKDSSCQDTMRARFGN
jgi:hypothetical protein